MFRPRNALWILILLISAVVGWWSGSFFNRRKEAKPLVIVVPEEDLNIGEVWETANLKRTVRFRNVSDKPIAITTFQTSCECTDVVPKSLTIPAGAEQSVTVNIDLRNVKTQSIKNGDVSETFSLNLHPVIAGSESKRSSDHRWMLRGSVKRILIPSAEVVNLGKKSCRSRTPLSGEVVVRSTIEINRCDFKLRGNDFVIRRIDHSDGQKYKCKIDLERLTPGDFQSDLTITPISNEGDRLPARTIKITGIITPDIIATPGSILFGSVRVGEYVKTTVALRSETSATFRVVKTQTSGGGIKITAVNASTFEVTQHVQADGSFNNKVHFQLVVGDEESPQGLDVEIEGNGYSESH